MLTTSHAMTIEKRSVSVLDCDWLYELHREVYMDIVTCQFGAWDEDEQLKFFYETWRSRNVTIITIYREPVGMFQFDLRNDHLWLGEIQIAPKYQNNGIGTKVILELISKARGVSLPLRLRVLHKNHRAISLYRKLGFCHVEKDLRHHVMQIV